MAKKDKLKALAEARGVKVEWYIDHVVVPMVNTHGQGEAARQLGVSQAAVSGWLKDRYVPHVWWLKAMSPEDRISIDAAVARHEAWEQEQEESL